MKSKLKPEVDYDYIPLSSFEIEEAYQNKRTITCYVLSADISNREVKVKLGTNLVGYIPFDSFTIEELTYSKNYTSPTPLQISCLVGKKVRAKIVSYGNGKIILSRKNNMEIAKKKLLKCSCAKMYVKNVTPSTVYGDIGDGISAVLPNYNISASYVENVSEFFHIGDEVWLQIKKNPDDDNRSFIMSYKDLFTPYRLDDYKTGEIILVKVINSVDNNFNGYYVEITPQVKGIMDVTNDLDILKKGSYCYAKIKIATPKGLKLNFIRKKEELSV